MRIWYFPYFLFVVVPIVFVVIPTAINPVFVITKDELYVVNIFYFDMFHILFILFPLIFSCFISDTRVFFGAFLGPILLIVVFNMFIFVTVVVIIFKHKIKKLGKVEKSKQIFNARELLSIMGIMTLFGLTWIFAAFTIREASLTFQIIFALCNSFQGFFLFLFFCVFSSEVRQLWFQCFFNGKFSPFSTSTGYKSKSPGDITH